MVGLLYSLKTVSRNVVFARTNGGTSPRCTVSNFVRVTFPGAVLVARLFFAKRSETKVALMGTAIGEKGARPDINVTPYIDILLVLLIIFMVVTPVRQKNLPVKVPQPALQAPPEAARPDVIVVTVGENAEIAINHVPTDISVLGSKLQEIYNARRDKNMFVSASPKLPYGDVIKVIDISKRAGVADIGLLSEEIR